MKNLNIFCFGFGQVAKNFIKKINLKIPVTMIHGSKDDTVPVVYSKRVLKIFTNAIKKILIIKNGDHSLFNKKLQKKILKELELII